MVRLLLLLDNGRSCGDGDARARFGERRPHEGSVVVGARRMDGVVTPGVAGMFWVRGARVARSWVGGDER